MVKCNFLIFLQYEKQRKMIIFFSSCEQVEFHYELLVNVLSGELSEQPKRSPVSSVQLQFLRLHGNMEQEVSVISHKNGWIHSFVPYSL